MRASFKVVLAIMSGIVTAGSIGFDIFNVFPNASWPVVYFSAFIIFILFMSWGWLSAEKRIRELIESKPSISVSYKTNYDGNLSIVNDGNTANFRAKAQQIKEGEPIGDEWFIKWKDSLVIDQTIYKGDSHTLEVASCEWIYVMEEGNQVGKPFFRFYKVPQSAIDIDTGERIIQHHNLPRRDTLVEIAIRIFSQPDLHLPFERRYLVKLIGDEDTVFIEEIPNGDK